jgi:3-hydroxyisobutyrate dehydrogenase
VQQLKANPKVNILLYDKESKVQLRIPAVAKIYHQDEVAQSRWELSQLTSRKCYMTDIASGVVMNRPFSTRHDMDLQIDGYEYFTAILCHYDRFEYMHLTAEGHERAFITFDGNEIMLEWRAP